jgi:ribosomal protein S18 acetylase RimI-like enzyme
VVSIERAQSTDWPELWAMIEPVFRQGETYCLAPDISEAEARRVWLEVPTATFVARDAARTALGTYFVKPNQPALGSHVCNCGYIVSEAARGRGVAAAMCEHSQAQARLMGFRAMQFNFVVSTNEGAVHLWQKLGFAIVGRLPGAFRHRRLGYVDALVMYKQLAGTTACGIKTSS